VTPQAWAAALAVFAALIAADLVFTRFSFLKPAIAVLLVFIGVKMLVSPFVHLPVTVTLAAIVVVAGGAVAAGLWRDRSLR
jgi:tellurite resistance protein TerC